MIPQGFYHKTFSVDPLCLEFSVINNKIIVIRCSLAQKSAQKYVFRQATPISKCSRDLRMEKSRPKYTLHKGKGKGKGKSIAVCETSPHRYKYFLITGWLMFGSLTMLCYATLLK